MKAKDVLNFINETGEMGQYDIEKGGEWYEARLELEKVAKKTGIFNKVKPFDQYQGPYALLKNGDKIWLSENPGLYYLQMTNGETLLFDSELIVDFYKKGKRYQTKPTVKVRK